VNGRVAPLNTKTLYPGPAFFYGWTEHTIPLMRQCLAEGREWYYADNAYYYGRGAYFRVTRNALMHDGRGKAKKNRENRFNVSYKPWRTTGDHVIVTTQSEMYYRDRLGITRDEWTASVEREIKRYTTRPVVVCHKPDARVSKNAAASPDFESRLDGAWALVTHSSSTAVKAVVDGIPVFSLGQSMVSSMGLSDLSKIETPVMPDDRERWLRVLLFNQWTLAEIMTGVAWTALTRQHALGQDPTPTTTL
jgi:hypothetical protein